MRELELPPSGHLIILELLFFHKGDMVLWLYFSKRRSYTLRIHTEVQINFKSKICFKIIQRNGRSQWAIRQFGHDSIITESEWWIQADLLHKSIHFCVRVKFSIIETKNKAKDFVSGHKKKIWSKKNRLESMLESPKKGNLTVTRCAVSQKKG